MDKIEPSGINIYVKQPEDILNSTSVLRGSSENIFEVPLLNRRQKMNEMKPLHLDFCRLRRRKTVSNVHELVNLEYIGLSSDEENIDA